MKSGIERYLKYLESLGKSAGTIDQANKSLKYFFAWCEERGLESALEVNEMTMERYQKYLYHYRKKDENPLSIESQNRRLGVVKNFFSYLYVSGYLSINPASKLKLPNKPKKLPVILSEKEAMKILSMPDTTSVVGIRDRAILELLYSTGIRGYEIENLKISDIDLDIAIMRIIGGRESKERIVPLGDRACKWLNKYIKESRPFLNLKGKEHLLLSGFGNPLKGNYISYLVTRYVALSGVQKKGSAGLFRHTVAHILIKNGADLRYVQEMMGHKSLESLNLYMKMNLSKLKEVHKQTHPAEKERDLGF